MNLELRGKTLSDQDTNFLSQFSQGWEQSNCSLWNPKLAVSLSGELEYCEIATILQINSFSVAVYLRRT